MALSERDANAILSCPLWLMQTNRLLPSRPGPLSKKRVALLKGLLGEIRARSSIAKETTKHPDAIRCVYKLDGMLHPSCKYRVNELLDRLTSAELLPHDAAAILINVALAILMWLNSSLQNPTASDTPNIAATNAMCTRVLLTLRPDAFEIDSPQILEEFGLPIFMLPIHDTFWAIPLHPDGTRTPIHVHSAPDNPEYYVPSACLPLMFSNEHRLLVSEGCAIRISTHDLKSEATMRFVESKGTMNPTIAAEALTHFRLKPTEENLDWYLRKYEERAVIITLHRNFGLTHGSSPFLESSNVTVIDDPEEVARWTNQILPQLGIDPDGGFVPFCFPPALSDAHMRLQKAHAHACLTYMQDPIRAQEEVVNATCEVLKEELGDTLELVGQLDEDELQSTLGAAKDLVSHALEALHQMQLRLRSLEDAAREALLEALDAALDAAMAKERLKEEWRRREHWVLKQSMEKKGPKKGKNKVRAESEKATPKKPSKEDIKQKVRSAVDLVEQRTRIYVHTAKSISTMKKLGVMQTLCPDASSKAEKQQMLKPSLEALEGGEIVELRVGNSHRRSAGPGSVISSSTRAPSSSEPDILPPGWSASIDPRSGNPYYWHEDTRKSQWNRPQVTGATTSPVKGRKPQAGYIQVLDALTRKDQELAAAHYNENALRIGLEMSLAGGGDRIELLDTIGASSSSSALDPLCSDSVSCGTDATMSRLTVADG